MPGNALDRSANGRFVKGHAGGPGRPRRAVEQEYLVRLSNVVTLDVWQKIIERSVADAMNGDAKARDFLAKYLIGDSPPTLASLAAAEQAGMTIDDQIAVTAGNLEFQAQMTRFKAGLHELLSRSPAIASEAH
jgi:hypothetical protein